MRRRGVWVMGVIGAALACRAPTRGSLTPVEAALDADVLPLASGADSVHVAFSGVLHNSSSDTLTVDTSPCSASLRLEYADGEQWRSPTQGTSTRACILLYSEVRIPPGDSTVLSGDASGVRAERYMGVRWVAPIPGRYRLVASATRCMRDGRRECPVTVSSSPFPIER